MKRNSLIFSLIITFFNYCAQNPNNWDTAFVRSFGGTSIDNGRDIKETSDNGFIILGTTSTFGGGNTSFYVIKTNSKGEHKWSTTLGTSSNDVGYSVEIANDGGFFFSGFTNSNIQSGYDGYLIKTDSLGNVLWSKNYGGSDWDFIYNSCIMPDGGVVLCGETYSDSNGGTDSYLIRTDLNGDTLWTKKIGQSGDDGFYSVEYQNGHIYAIGKAYNNLTTKTDASIFKFDINGNVVNQDYYSNNNNGENHIYNDLFITNNGNILLCGQRSTTTYDYYFIRKVDITNFVESKYATSPQENSFKSILEGNNGDVYMVGKGFGGLGGTAAQYFRFHSDFYYLNGAKFGGPEHDEGFEMIRTSTGYAFVGSTTSYGNQNISVDENVYLVIFNKVDLVDDYYISLIAFQDPLSHVGLKENNENERDIEIFPNPVINYSTLKINDKWLEGEILSFELYDIAGKLVYSKELMVNNKGVMIDRENLTGAAYNYVLKHKLDVLGKGKLIIK